MTANAVKPSAADTAVEQTKGEKRPLVAAPAVPDPTAPKPARQDPRRPKTNPGREQSTDAEGEDESTEVEEADTVKESRAEVKARDKKSAGCQGSCSLQNFY